MAIDFENRDDEHDRFLRKNLELSRAYDLERKDKLKSKQKKGELVPIVGPCYKCKKELPCLPFQITETGRYEGVVSVSKEMVQMCEGCAPKRRNAGKEISKKQINAMLRGAKRGRL